MAASPSHQLGEAIGDFFEGAIIQYLTPIAAENGYYLDHKHPRLARGNKKEVIGIDGNGNKHKLDIVIEENGSETQFGEPKAFIEMAWRRYVKHSKNKVQEISRAILPLVSRYAKNMPFYAAVLAGEFTETALAQLRSEGFYVEHFTYEEICGLFEVAGLSIRWEEHTSETEIQAIVNAFYALDEEAKGAVREAFFTRYQDRLENLATALIGSLETVVSQVIVVPLHGVPQAWTSIADAIEYTVHYDEATAAPILRYEIIIRYSNGDEYTMKCANRAKAIQFLKQYA